MASVDEEEEGKRTHQPRYFPLHAGQEDSRDVIRAVLETDECNTKMLGTFLGRSGLKKDDLVTQFIDDLEGGRLDPSKFLAHLCNQPRTMLAFQVGSLGKGFQARPAGDFLTKFDDEGSFYGPFFTNPAVEQWYISTRWVKTTVGDDEDAVSLPARWHCVFQVRGNLIACHWHNLSRRTAEGGETPFSYWQFVPHALDLLKQQLGANLMGVDLFDLVLQKLLALYDNNPAYEWTHNRIRADQDSVALNANSRVRKLAEKQRAAGIRSLTNALAKAAAEIMGVTDPDLIREVERRLLHVILTQWGTKSYEYKLDKLTGAAKQTMARMHVVFGLGSSGSDGFQHLTTWRTYGGSHEALRFLCQHAGVPL